MRKLTYWYARCEDDSNAYSVRERTKRAAVRAREELRKGGAKYGPVFKVTVPYKDAFDLLKSALGEGGVEPFGP